MSIDPNSLHCGRCEELIPQLIDNSVNLVVTSPPYACQRDGQYEGIPEKEYPSWMTHVLYLLKPKLHDDASILINIRPHLEKGVISDYVLRTRLMLRDSGWFECEELIWFKPDAPPLGSIKRPRRTWESILWFAKRREPYVDLLACGAQSVKIGFAGSKRFGTGGVSPLHAGQNEGRHEGRSRVTDVLTAHVGEIAKGVQHPAMFPETLPNQLISTFSRVGDLVLDPFVGSGTTLLSAISLNRNYIGFDVAPEYVELCKNRISQRTSVGKATSDQADNLTI